MRGEWNGLQALVSRECPYAYYVHYFAHRLQLSLVAASKEVYHVQHFFEKLNFIVNIVSASCKRNDQLRHAHASNVAFLLTTGELESGKGLNQLGSLQRAGDTRCLCNALKLQSQDILNAMSLVSTSKSLLQKLRDDGWSKLIEKVTTFCEKVSIEVPDFSAHHDIRRGASHQHNRITIEHYYRVDIFYTMIDSQLQELNNRFKDDTVELIILSSALDPKEMRTTLRVDNICKLVEKFYPTDFDEDERISLRMELQHFELVRQLPDFNTLIEISELCKWLTKTRKSNMFPLLYKINLKMEKCEQLLVDFAAQVDRLQLKNPTSVCNILQERLNPRERLKNHVSVCVGNDDNDFHEMAALTFQNDKTLNVEEQ
ncbi:hypothetical protein QQ045_017942 [Rhodiola kirilowii]